MLYEMTVKLHCLDMHGEFKAIETVLITAESLNLCNLVMVKRLIYI